jgi:hypothetical protein
VPFQNFVRPSLREDLIASIRIHFQGRSLAVVRFPSDFNAHASVCPIEVSLRPCRRAAEDKAYGPNNENLSNVVKQSNMVGHSRPRSQTRTVRNVCGSNLERIHIESMQALCHYRQSINSLILRVLGSHTPCWPRNV